MTRDYKPLSHLPSASQKNSIDKNYFGSAWVALADDCFYLLLLEVWNTNAPLLLAPAKGLGPLAPVGGSLQQTLEF